MTQLELFPESVEGYNNDGLPDGWVWTTLGEICTKPQYGYTTSATYIADGPKFLRITDLSRNGVDWDTVPYCEQSPEDSKKYRLVDGDLLIARSGATVGKAYRVVQPPEAIFASYLIRFRAIGVLDKYIEYYLQSPVYWMQIQDSSAGNTIPNVNASKMEGLILPLAPLDEQQRIVEAIESLFTQLDAGVGALKRLRANLRRYKAAVLKAACEGKLVPQDPNDEPASALLERILAERRTKWKAEQQAKGKDPRKLKYDEPATLDTTDLPELPEGWVWASFDQLLSQLKNGYFAGAPATEPPGIPILRIGAVRPLSVDLTSIRYIREEDERIDQYLISEGDLLFTRYNGNVRYVGACGMVRNLQQQTLYPDKLIRAALIDSDATLPQYLEYYFATDLPRSIIERNVVSSAGQNGISGPTLKAIPVALPPSNEQRRIVEKLEYLLSVTDAVEAITEHGTLRAERLRQAILKQAFEGKLVPQDPNDEPAYVLLERIKQGRGNQPRKKTR